MEFVSDLLKEAYMNLDVSNHIVDCQGWMDATFEIVFNKMLEDRLSAGFGTEDKPLVIVEVGSWKGLSTSTMARLCKAKNASAKIIAIDTWLGAPEFWTWGKNEDIRGKSLLLQNGYPSVFYTFTKNMKKLGHDDMIAPLPMASVCAVDILKYYGITPDIVYVDAAHEYESVKQDIQLYFKLVKDNGWIFGDDYSIHWHGVKKAVDELFPDKMVEGVVWYKCKHPGHKN
jgi:hypothetical protein